MKPLLCISIPLLASALHLGAAVATWTGGTNGTATDFASSSNWTPDAPAKGDIAQFSLPTAGQPVLDASVSVAGLDFVTPEGGWTLSGSGSLTLGSAGLSCSGQTAGLNTVNLATLVMASGSTTVWTIFDNVVAPSPSTLHICSAIRLNSKGLLYFKIQRPNAGGVGTLKLTGPISGSSLGGVKYQGVGGLKKNLFFLTGNNSTYEAPTIVSQASVAFDSLATTGNGSSFGSDGTVTVGDNNSFASVTYVGGGGATDRQWVLGGNGGASINNNGTGPIAFNSTESAISGSGRRRLMLGGTNTAENIFAELLSDIGGVTAVIKNDIGTWVLANAANSYTGTNAFNGGTVQVSKLDLGGRPSCIGASTSGPENLSFYNASLDYTGTGDACDRLFQMLGNTTLNNNGTGALNFNNAGSIVTGGGGAHTLTLGGTYAGVNTFAPSLGDNGATATSLTKRGATTWLLTGTNAYSGATTVRAGTLLINGTLGTGPVLVTSGGTLGGNGGSIAGAVTIQDGGTLALGADVSVLKFSDSLSFSSTSTNIMKIAKADGKPSSDLLQGMNMVSMDGTLVVTASGEALAAGDTFQLFKAAAYSGAPFAQLRLPTLAAGLSWNTSALATNGSLSITGPATAVPAVVASQPAPAPAASITPDTNAPVAVAPVAAAAAPAAAVPAVAVETSAEVYVDRGPVTVANGAVVRGPQGKPQVAILFSSCTANEETDLVLAALKSHKAPASFFVNSESLQWPMNQVEVRTLLQAGHFVGPQSDSWKSLTKGPSLFARDTRRYPEVAEHLKELGDLGVQPKDMRFFLALPDQVNEATAVRARACGLRMLSGTPGTLSLQTTTLEGKRGFVSSQAVLDSILAYEKEHGLNGFMLAFQLDSGPRRTDKFSSRVGELLDALQQRGYELVRVDHLLDSQPAK